MTAPNNFSRNAWHSTDHHSKFDDEKIKSLVLSQIEKGEHEYNPKLAVENFGSLMKRKYGISPRDFSKAMFIFMVLIGYDAAGEPIKKASSVEEAFTRWRHNAAEAYDAYEQLKAEWNGYSANESAGRVVDELTR